MTREKANKFYDEIAPHFEEHADGNMEAEMLDNLWDVRVTPKPFTIYSFSTLVAQILNWTPR